MFVFLRNGRGSLNLRVVIEGKVGLDLAGKTGNVGCIYIVCIYI